MKTRAITGFFFVLVMLAMVIVNAHTFTVFFIFLSAWCLGEFYNMTAKVASPNRVLGIAISTLVFSGVAAFVYGLIFSLAWLLLVVPLVAVVYIAELYRKQETPFTNLGYTFLGFLYVVLPFIFFVALAFIEGRYNYRIPLGFFLILWANDTGAYLSGKAVGRTKLFERISPNKTWEGFFGGVLLALVLGFIVHHFFGVFELWKWLSISLIISVFGTYGDLVESMLKRSLDVKDSGAVLPGHGGLLDRFDGLLLSAPVVYVFITLF